MKSNQKVPSLMPGKKIKLRLNNNQKTIWSHSFLSKPEVELNNYKTSES